MVFESVVVDILNRYLKPYVKKLDTSQLKVGVWKGHASLDKLELKDDLFAEADLDVPLKIKRSFIGKLEMQIPWKRLTKDPLVITIDEIYVIVGPNIETKYDADADLAHQRKVKEKKIEKFNEALKSKKKMKKDSKSKKKEKDSEKPDTFVEKLAVHLTKNLQVLVRDIHVRYEDSVTRPGITLSAGATLHSLEVKSTDDKWVPTVIREAATVIYKMVELNCLGVYWNSCDQSIASLDTQPMINEMRNHIARPAMAAPPSNAYILSPMTGTAKLKMNVKIDGDLSMPQLVGGIDVGDILLSLQQEQLKTLLSTVQYFDRYKLNQKYLRYKPSVALSEDRKGWWRYAITAVLEEDVKRRTRMWSWKHMKQHRDRCLRYQMKYHEKLHSVSVSSSLKEELQKLEDSMDWFNIMIYRKAASKKLKRLIPKASNQAIPSVPSGGSLVEMSDSSHRKVLHSIGSKEAKKEEKARAAARKEQEKAAKKAAKKEKKSTNRDFFSKLKTKLSKKDKEAVVGGASVASKEEGILEDVVHEEFEALKELTEDVVDVVDEELEKAREQLYKEIGYVENDELKYPKEYVGHEIHLNVNSLSVELFGRKSKIGNLVTKKIGLDLYHRPATNAVSVATSVHSVEMTGIPLNGRQTTLVTSLMGGANKPQPQLVNLQLEISPIDRPDLDVTVKAALSPIKITYDFATVNGLIEMFKPPKLIHFQELTQAASASWEELKSQTSASLKNAVKDRKQIEVDITLQSPFVVVPEKGQLTDDANLIVADLGKLSVYGRTTDKHYSTIKTRTDALEMYYDTFTIKLDGMQVLVAKPGEDWSKAMSAPGTSSLHILDPTGFEISLLKSIVDGDAYLPSLRVEGTLPGFDVKISDVKLASLLKVAGSMEKPPALITITDAYDSLPALPAERLALESVTEIADFDTLSISTVADDEEEEEEDDDDDEEEEKGEPTSSLQSTQKVEPELDDTAKHVFTDVSVKLTIKQIAVHLSQTEEVKRVVRQKPLLDVLVSEVKADVVDRKWDTQGSVSLGEMAIVDYITMDANGKPTYLLKTDPLNDGNFIFLRFVTITRVGADFAAKYTGLQDTVSAQLSLVRIALNRATLAALLQYAMLILPAIKKSPESPAAIEEEDGNASLTEESIVEAGLNPNDVAGAVPKKDLDLHFEVKFDGINCSLLEKQQEIVHTAVTGFLINGRAQVEKVTVEVKINDLAVDTSVASNGGLVHIISKEEAKKDILSLTVVQYNHPPHRRDPNDMNWVDTSLKVEMGRINVNGDATFLGSMLSFVKNLNINQELFQSAAIATAETATVTAHAIAETTKTAHRLKLSVLFHAPSLFIPYDLGEHQGSIHIDMGDFKVSNMYLHAHELEGRVNSVSILSAKTILDCIEIQSSSVQIYRSCHTSSQGIGGGARCSTILQPLQFTVQVRRNISQPSEEYPNVDVVLNLEAIKFQVQEEDVQSFLMIGETLMKSVTVLIPKAPPPQALPELQKTRAHTLMPAARAKRSSSLFSKFNTSRTRPRSTLVASKWQKAARLKRFHTNDGKEVRDVRVSASLKTVSVDFATIKSPLLNFMASDLNAKIDVYKTKVDVSASVDSMALVDVRTQGATSKVISLAEHTDKVSSLNLSVFLDQQSPMAPMGNISTNISQVQLIVSTPFVKEIVEFVQRQNFDFAPNVLENASKVAQDGATAMTSMAHDKYFKVDVTVHAPVLIIPVSDQSDQGFMVDLGSLEVRNTLLVPDQSQVRVGIDAYGISLDSFKISRVLLDGSREGSPVVAERVLLQPFHMMLALERNLCSWYHQIPTLCVNLTMGDLAIFLGQEDLEQFYTFGTQLAEQVTPLLPVKQPSVSSGGEGPADTQSTTIPEAGEEKEAPYENFRIMSSLPQFELKLFKGEPHLSSSDAKSADLRKCEGFSLASLQLVTMDLKVHVSSRTEVEVQASMKDIALIDGQQRTQKRNTGNRVVQHFTSNPLKAFTGKIDKPLISIDYFLTADKDSNIIVRSHDLLILSDVEFMSTVANYLRAIFQPESKKNKEEGEENGVESGLEDTVTVKGVPAIEAAPTSPGVVATKDLEQEAAVVSAKPLPKIKCQFSITNFRVAIVEDVYSEQPQAISLNLTSLHTHLQLGDVKHASLSVSELGIATSSFFDLNNTTSWILLPCSLQVTMTGPPNLPAMEINGSVDPISLTLSPSIVRLIIHAVQTLMPVKENKVDKVPRDLWAKQFIGRKFWFLNNAPAHKPLPNAGSSIVPTQHKEEYFIFNIESVEIILEDEATSQSAARPMIALNCTAVLQLYEWTGQLRLEGEAHVEATYFNQSLSLWEPILETLVRKDGRQELWDMQINVEKAPPRAVAAGSEGDLNPRPDFSLQLLSNSPLQLTLTRTSLMLVKSLVESYSKEYVKQVEGNVKVQSLTGAPYTVINKLGSGTPVFVKPGSNLAIVGSTGATSSKLADNGNVNLKPVKLSKRRSHASLLIKHRREEATIDIAVGSKFIPLKNVLIDSPGCYYYTLVPNQEHDATMSTYGLIVDVAVTGTKKTILIRSPIQFKNHLQHDIDVLSLSPDKKAEEKVLTVLKQDQIYHVPIDVAQTHTFSIRPTGFGFTPVGPRISWQQRKDSQHMELKCVMAEDDSLCFFSQVVFREERYKAKRNLAKETDYPHHIFHIYPTLMLQNLLPQVIFIEAMDHGCPSRSLEPGQSLPIHELDLGKVPEVRLSVILDNSATLNGKFTVEKKQSEYTTFPTISSGPASTPTVLTLHAEDLGYLKVGIFCAFWMVNKTGLALEYKEGSKTTFHPTSKDMVLLSTTNKKSKIQLRAKTVNDSYTDWTKSFSVNAVGTSGNFSAKLGENVYRFGVEINLSKFTLTKIVMVTPYYLLVNKTKDVLKVHEKYSPSLLTTIPAGGVVPFWTLNDSEMMVLVAGDKGKVSSSLPFNFKKPDNTVLQFDSSNEVVAVCLEVQEAESATVITFSPYHQGCVPLLVINHFPDVSLRFAQGIKGSVIVYSLSPRESLNFTWDYPLKKKLIKWNFPGAYEVQNKKVINVTKDCEGKFRMSFEAATTPGKDMPSLQFKQTGSWIEVDDSLVENDIEGEDDEMSVTGSLTSELSSVTGSSAASINGGSYRGFWKCFSDGLQRVLVFTPDESVLLRIKEANSFSISLFEASLTFKYIGLSLVDNERKKELAYVSVAPSGVIWQLDKGKKKRIWKTLNISVIAILEEAYQQKKKDIKVKDLAVNLETMEMFSPLKGKLRRTHHDGLHFKFTMTEQDFAIHAKIGHLQVDNQLPFSVYPQVIYPLPPPPTVASATEPKPFVEASIILKKPDQSNVLHFKYVHVLVQKISLNVDLGFILSLVDFFTLADQDALLEAEYVKSDIEYTQKSLMETVVPELADDISTSRIFFDVLHLSPIKINLSFNIRSVGRNKGDNEISVGDRFLHLFLDSIGVILTSVQDTEMKFSLFHLEYQPQTAEGMKKLLIKHYRNQALFELHTLIFGLDVLGNPESVVRGVVIGAKDLFYEPFKGSVLGPEEFFEGLGLGLRSFFGAGVLGGLTGAGARITGAFGDVFAKLTFDEEFIEQRQQTKAKPPKLGWKLGGFAKNVFEGVTGVVTQPVKGLQKEGAVGLLKGTGKGLVGLLVRPTGGLVDLASGTLDFVTRKTKIGNFEVSDVRPPRYIGREGVIQPYSAEKAVGAALLVSVDEGTYVDTDYYVGHVQVQVKPPHFLIVTDRRFLLIERKILTEGWKAFQDVGFNTFESPVEIKETSVVINYSKAYKDRKFRTLGFKSSDLAESVGPLINDGYINYFLKEQ